MELYRVVHRGEIVKNYDINIVPIRETFRALLDLIDWQLTIRNRVKGFEWPAGSVYDVKHPTRQRIRM